MRTSWKANAPPGRTRRAALRNRATGCDWWTRMYRPITRSKGFIDGKLFNRGAYKTDLSQTGLLGPLSGHVENILTAIDTDDEACWAYQFGGEHGDIASTTAQVQHAHASINSCAAQQTLGDRSQHGRLILQTLNLCRRMSKCIGCLAHLCSYSSRSNYLVFHLHESHGVECWPCACIGRTRAALVYSQTRQEILLSEIRTPSALFVLPARNIGRCKSVSHHRVWKKLISRLSINVESNEVIGLIPYLSPELIAAILKRESTSAVDLQADSKSLREHSFPTLRSQSGVNEKLTRVPFRRKAWLRCSRLFTVVGRLVVPWVL